NDTATYFVDNREIWVVPMLNPDGHYVVQEIYDLWRKNTRDNNNSGQFETNNDGVDLNRNYGYMWGYDNTGSSPDPTSATYRGPGPFSEPETQALRDFCIEREFTIALNYHSSGRLLLYPWGFIPQNTPDHDIFVALADQFVAENGYIPGNSGSGIIYSTNGGTCDWLYGAQGIFGFTPEVGSQFLPPDSEIPALLAETFPINIAAAFYAANPYSIRLPQTPIIDELSYDGDGNFTISWTTLDPDPNNLAVSYSLREKSGRHVITDNAEVSSEHWDLAGFAISQERAYSGLNSYYSGYANNLNSRMTAINAIEVTPGMNLTFRAWYDIENNYDYAYVAVSTDGLNFTNIAGNITTNYNPNGNNQGHGITGSSNEWVEANFDLESFLGLLFYIQFLYVTDNYTLGEGFYIDDISPVIYFDFD
ncbi:MAG: hypothetical protein GY869_22980, partial [Planctomycetes bacterium]|nr:hypothetical protein [Planctomycetota bacterium]